MYETMLKIRKIDVNLQTPADDNTGVLSLRAELAAGGEPSTWLPPGRPVEHPKITLDDQKIILD